MKYFFDGMRSFKVGEELWLPNAVIVFMGKVIGLMVVFED